MSCYLMENIERIERYVGDLLTVSGFREDGEEHTLWVLLHHLYSAVAMYELATEDEKDTIAETQKKLRYFFETKCDLKERKRNKKENEKLSPTPPIKEKENNKEKAEKNRPTILKGRDADLNERKEIFRKECSAYVGKYDNQRLAAFFKYWSEETRATGKMRFEAQRFWNLENRLARWMQNRYTSSDTAAAIRLEKTKKKQAAATSEAVQQKRAAEDREKQQRVLEQQVAESKRDSSTMEEQVARNPNGILARFARERKAREQPHPD